MNKVLIACALAGAAALGALAVSYSQAQEPSGAGEPFSSAEKDQIESLIADYIANNPEAMIESLNAYSERQRERQKLSARENARNNLARLTADDGSFTAGKDPENADVAVIEFYDYHCGFCKRVTGLVQDLTQNDDAVKVVFRELPILKEESEIAARYSLASKDQGKFVDYHVALMNASGTLTEKRVLDIAKEVGLDTDKLKTSARSVAESGVLESNQNIAREIGADGTPTFVVASVNHDFIEIIPGYDPEALQSAIEEAKRAR